MAERNNSLPRNLSLKSRVEISQLIKSGRRYPGNLCTLVYLPDDRFAYGIFLSKAHGSACQRNRTKRLFREAVRLDARPKLRQGRLGILPKRMDPSTKVDAIRGDINRVLKTICAGK